MHAIDDQEKFKAISQELLQMTKDDMVFWIMELQERRNDLEKEFEDGKIDDVNRDSLYQKLRDVQDTLFFVEDENNQPLVWEMCAMTNLAMAGITHGVPIDKDDTVESLKNIAKNKIMRWAIQDRMQGDISSINPMLDEEKLKKAEKNRDDLLRILNV